MDPKRRPTAKELNFDPFIMKSRGPALLSELVMRSLEDIEQFRAGYDDEESQGGSIVAPGTGSVIATGENNAVRAAKKAGGGGAGAGGKAGDAEGLKTYVRADEESKEEVGEYIEVYEDGGTMMIKDPEPAPNVAAD